MTVAPAPLAPPQARLLSPPAERWDALTDAAEAVSVLAARTADQAMPNWDELTSEAAPWRIERAERDLSDLSAVMRAGLTALLAVKAHGADPRAAAAALLDEFAEALEALCALLRPVA